MHSNQSSSVIVSFTWQFGYYEFSVSHGRKRKGCRGVIMKASDLFIQALENEGVEYILVFRARRT